MKESNATTPKLLFVSVFSPEAIEAAAVFNSEGEKAELSWVATAKCFHETEKSDEIQSLSLDDLQHAQLVILIRRLGSTESLKAKYPSWNGKSDVWEIQDGSNFKDMLSKLVGGLVVRLILQGGKRKPLMNDSATGAKNQQSQGNGDPSKQTKSSVLVSRESKGRGGKVVTLISGLMLEDMQIQELATKLKQLCGTGGTVKDGHIEIQGDQRDRIVAELQKRGYKAKRSGG